MTRSPRSPQKKRHVDLPTTVDLEGLIEEATVDANGDSEQTTGFLTMMEDHLSTPFRTELLGMEVTVEGIDLTEDEQIVAIYVRGRSRQNVPILDLPPPDPLPRGWEWIEAYRQWARGR